MQLIEVEPDVYCPLDSLRTDKKQRVKATNTCHRRLEALAWKMACEIRLLKVLGMVALPQKVAEVLFAKAFEGKAPTTPYEVDVRVKEEIESVKRDPSPYDQD